MAQRPQTSPRLSEVQRRIGFTVLMLLVYRLGVVVPTPGVDKEALAAFFEGAQGTILSLFNLFSGGALEQFSILALGIMPYITASIVFQLLVKVFKPLEEIQKEGELGRRRITQYTRYATIGLCIVQAAVMARGLESLTDPLGRPIVTNPGWGFRAISVVTLTSGTALLMWIGEKITERGIGNGISLIIFAGIVARVPAAISNTYRSVDSGELQPFMLFLLGIFMVGVLIFIIWMERAHRRIPVQYPQRMQGRRMVQGQQSYLPLRLNTAGVIPPIFASSLMFFIPTLAQMTQGMGEAPANAGFLVDAYYSLAHMLNRVASYFQPGGGYYVYEIIYGAMIVLFAYFYTAITFDPFDVADNLRRNGGFVPGIRPGNRTAEYIDRILTRLTFLGAVYLVAVCLLPSLLSTEMGVPFYFGGTGLLIVVGVALDTARQVETLMISRSYEGFFGEGRSLRGASRRGV